MELATIVLQLKIERNRLDCAISALEGLSSNDTTNGTGHHGLTACVRRHAGMTMACRKRVSDMMKNAGPNAERRLRARVSKH
jgi:hypothetical protein